MTAETGEAFRARVRAWLDANAPRKGDPGDSAAARLVSASTPGDYRRGEPEALAVPMGWQRRLFDAGFAGRSWPRQYGGAGAPAWQDEVVADEQSRYGVSTKMISVAPEMGPPGLFEHGTPQQRAGPPPRSLPGDEGWGQLLSRPGAGSPRAGGGAPPGAPGGGGGLVEVGAGARGGIRPREGEPPGDRRDRRVVGRRPEGVDVGRRHRRLRPAAGAERAGARAGGTVLLRRRHARARLRSPPAAADVGRLPLQRGLPR